MVYMLVVMCAIRISVRLSQLLQLDVVLQWKLLEVKCSELLIPNY